MLTEPLLMLVLQQVTVTGVVRDSVRSEPVAFAQVTAADSTGLSRSVTTDRFGAFVVTAPGSGPIRLTVAAVGYAEWTSVFAERPSGALEILLGPAPLHLDPIGARTGARIAHRRQGFVIDSALIANLPKVLETDVFRATTLSPAASANSDFAALPTLRGGTMDGVPVMLDGIRLFNPFHLGGFFGAINAEAVDHVAVVTSADGSALRHGSHSGAIEVSTRDGARDRVHTSTSIGLASARFSLEGPVGASSSFLVDGRRTYLDLFTAALREAGAIDDRLPYRFSDIHAKVTRDLGGLNRVSASAYVNRESLDDIDRTDELVLGSNWSNAAVSLHGRFALSPRALVDITVGHSRFTSDGDVKEEDRIELDAMAMMAETRLDSRLSWHTPRADATLGLQVSRYSADFDVRTDHEEVLDYIPTLDVSRSQARVAGYADVVLQTPWSARVGFGARVDHFPGLATALSPALSVETDAGRWNVRLALTESRQDLHSLRDEESRYSSYISYDLLLPVTDAPLLRSREASITTETQLGSVLVRGGAYRRSIHGLRLPALGEVPIAAPALVDPERLEHGSMTATGIELGGEWRGPTVSLLGGYRWSRLSRTVADMEYVPRFHRDHELEAAAVVRRGRSSFSSRLSIRSGQRTTPVYAVMPAPPVAPPDGSPISAGFGVVFGDAYNSATLPAYARVDIGWRTERGVSFMGARGRMAPYVAIMNVLNSKNVVSAQIDRTHVRPTFKYAPQLPTLPFAGVEFRF